MPLYIEDVGEVEMLELLTAKEVAQQLRVDQTTVRRWIKEGILEGVLLPHTGERAVYRIKRSTVNTILGSEKDEL